MAGTENRTGTVISTVIHDLLKSNGFDVPVISRSDQCGTEIASVLQQCTEFATEAKKIMSNLKLNRPVFDILEDAVVKIFNDKDITWKKIALLLQLGGELCMKIYTQSHGRNCFQEITSALTRLIEKQEVLPTMLSIGIWIQNGGGWDKAPAGLKETLKVVAAVAAVGAVAGLAYVLYQNVSGRRLDNRRRN